MPRLESYRFGRLVVNGEEPTRDVIVPPETGRNELAAGRRTPTRPGPASKSTAPAGWDYLVITVGAVAC